MENQDYIRQVEINGVKIEVDLRTAKRVDVFKIGDNVKILKKTYNNQFSVYSGVIVDFVAFKELPAIVVCYFENGYSHPELHFETITKDTTDIEIAPCLPTDLRIDKERVIDKFNIAIDDAQRNVDELVQRRDYFVENFSKFFDPKQDGGEQ